MSQPITAILIGAGNRGYEEYGPYALAHPDEIRFVAIAEPHEARRARFARAHDIATSYQFHTWEDLLARSQMADAALVCTLDRMHVEPTIAALEAGYDVLLEKPMATTLADCVRLVRTAERTGRLLQICHVLRYSAFFSSLHDIVTSGRLGDVITVEHRENVAYWHMAHSFVRGNWRDSQVESPMILAKCCHDFDLLYWILGPCARLSSFGSLIHFRPENAPDGAPERCTDGCPAADDCPWYAPRLYLDMVPLLHVARRSPAAHERLAAELSLRLPSLVNAARRSMPGLEAALDYRGWPISVISEDTAPQARWEALQTGPYGRCVYHCGNDVVDHQIVNIELEQGGSAVLVMHGHSHREGRTMRYDGTRATLRGCFYPEEQRIEIHDHLTGDMEVIRPSAGRVRAGGHGGGDAALMRAFVHSVRSTSQGRGSHMITSARDSLESHLMAFAAERARLEGIVLSMDEFRRQAEALAEV
jgi:predicted dehydrogenase